jgi:hypothetical protein
MGTRSGDWDVTGAGPIVSRRALGVSLRHHREVKGLSRVAVGEALKIPDMIISGLELGQIPARLRDVIGLCELYGIDDLAERATLLGLAREANVPGWWAAFADVIPSWFELFLALEQAADVIRSYDLQFVPAFLQTSDYAREVIDLEEGPAELEHRLALRMLRQRRLHSGHPPQVWAILDEAVLRRPVGSPATMFRQLQHLADLCEIPHLTVQILPFSVGGQITGGAPITLLSTTGLVDVVYLEQLTTALYLDLPEEVAYYRHILSSLATTAPPPAQTPRLLRQIMREL